MKPSLAAPRFPRSNRQLTILALASLIALAPPAAKGAGGPSSEALAARALEYMAARQKRDQFSGTVLVAREGRILFCRGYGMANLEHDIPCTATTKFRLGSITKQFTAMAILILQERGKLSVTDKVKKYVTAAPAAWD